MNNMQCDAKIIRQNEQLMNILRFYKNIDRSELSRRLQISMPTVYKSIDELSNNGVINKVGNDIFLNEEYAYLIGVSIGSSLCKIVFVNINFEILKNEQGMKYKKDICKKINEIISDNELLNQCWNDESKNYIYFKTPDQFSELKEILDGVFEYIQESIEQESFKVASIGISCTGIINNKTQTILSAHNLEYLDNSTIESLVFPGRQKFFNDNQIDIYLVQNSDASVIAEKINLYKTDSPYKYKKNIISLYLGVGVGVGIYLNGLYSGTSGYSGEIGHTKAPMYEKDYLNENNIQADLDKTCTCGNVDCYDYKIRTYVFQMNKSTFSNLSASQIRECLYDKNKATLLGKYLGDMVNTLTNLLNIDLIIFTGKLYKSMDLLYNAIDSVRDDNKLKFSRNDCTLLTSNYGSLAPAIGAAIYSYYKKYNLKIVWDFIDNIQG